MTNRIYKFHWLRLSVNYEVDRLSHELHGKALLHLEAGGVLWELFPFLARIGTLKPDAQVRKWLRKQKTSILSLFAAFGVQDHDMFRPTIESRRALAKRRGDRDSRGCWGHIACFKSWSDFAFSVVHS